MHQDILDIGCSVHLEAPVRIETNSLDLERTYAIDTIIYILNRTFRMHQDILDIGWIELFTPDIKKHKINGVLKVFKEKQKKQAIIIIEFSYGRKAPNKARVYLIQTVNGYIIIKYFARPLPSIYILQRFASIKIPVSFYDFEQFAKDMVDLMSWQADVLETIKAINKVITVSI
ncbi:hypothetical protein Glove_167g78 [Diversispora epigaea]|uniref:Uncharacterized protein n=1 Tax=Diversispora epigaea TaxID=1348612 RepID=A0A397IYH6_9GLOM|nr:hypothetical protein Glove_167g78 [Diversispora epigaea]